MIGGGFKTFLFSIVYPKTEGILPDLTNIHLTRWFKHQLDSVNWKLPFLKENRPAAKVHFRPAGPLAVAGGVDFQ